VMRTMGLTGGLAGMGRLVAELPAG
jgi:hypothetical protein